MGWEGVHRACRQTASVRTTKGLADRVVVGRHLGGGWPVQAPLRKEAEGASLVVDAFLELSCFSHDPADVGHLLSGSGSNS